MAQLSLNSVNAIRHPDGLRRLDSIIGLRSLMKLVDRTLERFPVRTAKKKTIRTNPSEKIAV